MDKVDEKIIRKAAFYMHEAYYWSESIERACEYVGHMYPEIDPIVLRAMWEVVDTGVELIV